MVKDDVQKILKAFEKYTKKEVLVGIPGEIPGSEVKSETPGKPPKNMASNAYLGYIHEYGSPKKNIPPRPFLIPGVTKAQPDVMKILAKAAKNISVDTNDGDIEKSLKFSGEIAVANIKEIIVKSEGFEKLKESTLKQRERNKIQSKKPLIRTGSLLNSITYIVRDN